MPDNNNTSPPSRITNREAIDRMTADAYRRGGQSLADAVRKRAERAARRSDRDTK